MMKKATPSIAIAALGLGGFLLWKRKKRKEEEAALAQLAAELSTERSGVGRQILQSVAAASSGEQSPWETAGVVAGSVIGIGLQQGTQGGG